MFILSKSKSSRRGLERGVSFALYLFLKGSYSTSSTSSPSSLRAVEGESPGAPRQFIEGELLLPGCEEDPEQRNLSRAPQDFF